MGNILLGVLQMTMPDDPADLDLVTWVQVKDRMNEAANEITALRAENEKLRSEVELLRFVSEQRKRLKAMLEGDDT